MKIFEDNVLINSDKYFSNIFKDIFVKYLLIKISVKNVSGVKIDCRMTSIFYFPHIFGKEFYNLHRILFTHEM